MRNFSLFLVSLLTIVVVIAPFYLKTLEVSGQTKLKRFSSYEELKNFLKTNSQGGPYYDEGLVKTFGLTPRALTESGAKGGEPVPHYSTTSIQVERKIR